MSFLILVLSQRAIIAMGTKVRKKLGIGLDYLFRFRSPSLLHNAVPQNQAP
jgi:hypothetical protein